MKKATTEKLETLYNALLRHGINPNLIAKSDLFKIAAKEYVDGEIGIITILDIAQKLNILGDGRFTEKADA